MDSIPHFTGSPTIIIDTHTDPCDAVVV